MHTRTNEWFWWRDSLSIINTSRASAEGRSCECQPKNVWFLAKCIRQRRKTVQNFRQMLPGRRHSFPPFGNFGPHKNRKKERKKHRDREQRRSRKKKKICRKKRIKTMVNPVWHPPVTEEQPACEYEKKTTTFGTNKSQNHNAKIIPTQKKRKNTENLLFLFWFDIFFLTNPFCFGSLPNLTLSSRLLFFFLGFYFTRFFYLLWLLLLFHCIIIVIWMRDARLPKKNK